MNFAPPKKSDRRVSVRLAALAAILLLAAPLAAAAHGRDAVPKEPEWRARYESGLAAFYSNDHATALEDWKAVAERPVGSSAAQLFLGFMHATGLGVQKDPAAAVEWYGRAASQDHPLAQIHLALLYKRGDVVARDPVQAFAWSSLAARQEGHLQGVATALREALAREMSPDQVTEAEGLAARLAATHRAGE